MADMLNNVIARPAAKQGLAYLAKAAALVVLLFALSRAIPVMPPAAVAFFWAALSALSVIGVVYHGVVRKVHNGLPLNKGGVLSRINAGRILSLVVGFVVSAVLVAGLLLESPKWEAAEWCLVGLSVPVYYAVFILAGRLAQKEIAQPFQMSLGVLWSCGIAGLLLCLAYAAMYGLQPAPDYANMADAYLAAKQPFADSPSALLAETGKVTALADALTAYGFAKASQVSFVGYLIWRVAVCASAFFGIASLLGLCSLGFSELKKVFLPLEASLQAESRYALVKRFVAVAVALPVCLVAAFCLADYEVGKVAQTEEHTAAETFVRDQIDLAVFLIDGKYYEQRAVQELLEAAREKAEQLSDEAEATLVPLINESFDARLANVDGYLDWYYSLPADYERLMNLVIGTAEGYATEQFMARIDEGVDDSGMADLLKSYAEQAEALQNDLAESLAQYEIEDVPEWLLIVDDEVDLAPLADPLEPAQRLLDAPTRLGVSAAAGIGAGIVVKRLVKKAATKAFFKQVVSKITSVLSSKAIGSVAGGAAGAVGGPAGMAAGVAVGLAASLGVDYVLLKADEHLNRETYKQEIIDTIEEGRAEMLALVQ